MYYDHEGKTLEPYSKAPLEVLHDKQLKDFSKLLYFEMYSIYEQNRKNKDYIFPKNETLADNLGVAVVTIKKSLKELEEHGLIDRKIVSFVVNTSQQRHIYLNPLTKNDNDKISYTEFPKSLYFEEISSLQKLIIIELISLQELFADDESIEISNQKLADLLGKGRSTIIRNLKELEEMGYITIHNFEYNKRVIRLEHSKIFHKSYNFV